MCPGSRQALYHESSSLLQCSLLDGTRSRLRRALGDVSRRQLHGAGHMQRSDRLSSDFLEISTAAHWYLEGDGPFGRSCVFMQKQFQSVTRRPPCSKEPAPLTVLFTKVGWNFRCWTIEMQSFWNHHDQRSLRHPTMSRSGEARLVFRKLILTSVPPRAAG